MTNGCQTVVYPNSIPVVPRPGNLHSDDSIVFSGNLEYHPNQQAVAWFGRHVWPGLRRRFTKLRWRIIGKNPHGVKGFVCGLEGVELTGPVENAVESLAISRVAIVPVLAGSGTRVKILEAWAAGLPVVSTSLGAEGLEAIPGRHYLSADTSEEFLRQISGLLEKEAVAAQLGSAGRCLYEERFTWEAAWQELVREKFLMPERLY